MDKQTVTNFFKGIRSNVVKHSPEILTAVGIAGMISTTVLAVKATPKALKLIEDEKKRQNRELIEEAKESGQSQCPQISKLKPIDTVKIAWKPYVPAVITGTLATACLIGANSVHAKRNAALAAAYQLSTSAMKEYKEKVIETIGEKKEKTVHDKIAKGQIEKNPVETKEVIFTGKGETLCLDVLSGRYFKSDKDKIMRAMNDLNYQMSIGMEMSISLNEFYDEIGLPRIPMGEDIGWTVGKGLIDIHFSAQLTDDDEPCMVIEHLIPPEYGFNKLY